jgi:hypothetical protein
MVEFVRRIGGGDVVGRTMNGQRGPPSSGRNTKVLRRVPSRIGTMA